MLSQSRLESSWIIPKFRTDTTVSGKEQLHLWPSCSFLFFFSVLTKVNNSRVLCSFGVSPCKCDDVGSIFLASRTIFKRNIFSEKIRENLVLQIKKIPRI